MSISNSMDYTLDNNPYIANHRIERFASGIVCLEVTTTQVYLAFLQFNGFEYRFGKLDSDEPTTQVHELINYVLPYDNFVDMAGTQEGFTIRFFFIPKTLLMSLPELRNHKINTVI